MNKSLRFKLLTKFTSLIHSLTAHMNRRGIAAKKGLLAITSVGLFFLFTLNPFSSRAQFPYDESFRNSTTNKPDVKFGGDPTAFLTALKPISGSVTDAQGEGYLRLTNNTKKQKGYVYSNNIFLGTYGLNIEFEYFTYGGGNDGADGLSFFLFDASVADADFNIGGFGGSLGYAQLNKDGKDFKGVSKGYLGIGLDEFGNFSNHGEGRQGDKDQIPNSIVLRGAGDGFAYVPTNYPLLTTVKTSALATDAFNIAGGSRTAKDGDPEYRKVFINLVPRQGGGLLISVSIKHGGVITPVIVKFPYTTPIPAKGLKYGIASSTGDNVNYHEIRGLTLTVDKSVLSQPVAPSPSMIICQGASGSLDILAGATKPNAGGDPNPDNVDLNPLTTEIDRQFVTDAGTFVFDNVNTKLLTFTPKQGFSGSSAPIQFTFMDVYGAKSTVGTATFNINSPIIVTQPVSTAICENSNFTTTVAASGPSLSYQWQVNTGSSWDPVADPDGSLGSKTNTLNITRVPFTYNGYKYRVQVSSPGGCNIISDIISLTVNQLPTAAISPLKQDVCQDSPDIPVTFSGKYGAAPYTFYYTISDGTVKSAIKTLTTSGSSNSITINHPANVPGVFTYEIVKVSNSTCSNDLITRSKLTIIPNASVGLAPLSGTAVQNVCVGVPMQSIVYQVKDADEATVSFNKINPGITFIYDAVKQTITISGTSSLVGKFPFTVNTIGGCSTASTTGEINVLPNTAIALTSAVKTDQQEVCVNHGITQIEYQVTNGKNATVVGLPAEMVSVYNAVTGKFTISGTPVNAGLITYTITATGDCNPASITGTINVKPDVTIALTSAVKTDQQELCVNKPITQIEYQVSDGKAATVTGLPAELTSVYNAVTGKFTISGTPVNAGLITYTITATGDCNPASITGTINVKPDVTIALVSALKTDQQELCVNKPITQIEYQVTNGKAATITGLPVELTGVYNNTTGKFTISGTPVNAGLITYTITATGDCKLASITGTINVKPDVTIALTSAVKTDQQEMCLNKAITQIEYQVTNGKAATITGLPAELTSAYDALTGKFTISGTPTTAGLITYTITATGDCKLAGITGTINVKPDVTIALTSAVKTDQQELCVNKPITQIEYQVTNGKAATITGLPAELTSAYDALTGKFTISGTPATAGLITYTITATGDCKLASITGTINVKPDVTIALTSAVKTDQQELCVNKPITQIEYQVTNGKGATITGLPAELTGVYNNTTGKFTISGTPVNEGLITYTIMATGDCKLASITGTINVKPDVTVALTSAVNTDQQELCVNKAITQIEYQVVNGKAATITGLPAELTSAYDAVTGKFTISGTPVNAGLITYTITATGDCKLAGITGTINVKPDVTIALTSAVKTDQQELCVNKAITQIEYHVTNGKAATITGLPSTLTGVYNNTTGKFTITGTPSTAGLITYTITATGDCKLASITGTINVKPDVTIALTSAVNTDQQELCVNKAITQIEYQVTNGKNATIIGLPAELTSAYDALTGKFTISGTPATAGLITYTITATGDCKLANIIGTINVKPDVTIALTSAVKTDRQELCVNIAITQIEYQVTNGKAAMITGLPAELISTYDALAGKFIISGTPATAGQITYTITATGDCKLANITGTINVKPDVSLVLLSGTKDQTVCINAATIPIVYTVANETGAAVDNLPAGIIWKRENGKITISGTPTVSGTLHYKITATGDCQSATAEGDLTVKPDVSLLLLSGAKDQTVCINAAITPIVYTVANETGTAVDNLPAGIIWKRENGKITISGTPTVSGTLHYKITATGDCQSATAEGDLTVKPDVSLVLLSGAKDQTVCINAAITPIVYTVANETGAAVDNLPAGIIWKRENGKITISGTPTVSGTLHYKITATGDCQSATAEGDLTVKPDVSLLLLSGAKDQTVCINAAITPIVYTVANETGATVDNLPAGIIWKRENGKITISGTPTVSGTLHYKITATGDCQSATAEGDLTVKPDVSLLLLSGAKDQTVCINAAITPIVYTVANETGATVDNLPAGIIWKRENGKITISGTPTVSGTLHYKITATGDCQSATAEGDLTVKPDVSLTLLSGAKNQSICINTAIEPIIYTVANETGATVDNLPAGIIWKRENGKITISGTSTVSGTLHYKITATGDCQSATAEGDITVKPDVSLTLLSGAKDQTVCINAAITPIVYTVANETGAAVDNLPAGIIWKRENGKITISGTPTVSGTLHYKITATGDCQSATAEGDLTVKPDVSLVLLSGTKDQTVCINAAITPIIYTVANETGAAVDNLPAGIIWKRENGKITISGTPTVSGTLHYKITATGDCQSATAEGDLTVKPDVSLLLLSGAKDQTVCINAAITPIVYTVANETGATVDNLPAGIIWKRENGKITISGTPTVSGTLHYKITATGDCQSATAEGDLTVKPDVSLTLLSGAKDQTVCINAAIIPIVYTVANETAVTVDNLPAGVSWIQAGNKITISGTPTVSGTLHYKITATGDCQSATAEGDLTVKPDVSLVLLSGAKDQTVCINAAITPIVYTVANETGAAVDNLPAGIIWKRENGKITISGTPTVSGTLHYKITATGDCQSATAEGDLKVKPDVSLTLLSGAKNQSICINTAIEPIIYTVANETGATVDNLPAGIIWKRENGKITISGTPTVSGTLHYKITATGDCKSATAEGDLTVKPDVSLTLLSGAKDQTVCINAAIIPIVYTVANETAVTVDNLPAGVSWIQAGNKITISGTPTVSGTLHYKITATGDCQSATAEGDLTVKPDVSLTLLSGAKNQPICINTAIEPIIYTVANETGATVDNLPAGIIWKRENGKITISGTPTVSGTLHYKITATGDCQSATAEGDLTVKPDVSLTLLSGAKNQSICINTAIEPIIYTVTNETAATVDNLPAGIIWKHENGKITISGTPTVSGTLHYKITATGDCQSAIAEGDLTVKPDVTITLTSAVNTDKQELCVNKTITQIEYQTTNAKNTTASGLPAELTGVYNNTTGKFTITGTPSTAGLITYTITATGDCKTANITGTIFVKPTVELVLTTGSNNQSSCINTPISNTIYTVSNGTAVATNLPPGLNQNYANGLLTISGIPTQSGTFIYTITATGDCGTKELHAQIDVYPNAIMELLSPAGSDQPVLCINTSLHPITYKITNATGATISALPAGLTSNYDPATKQFTITGAPSISGTFPYTITTTGGCASVILTGTIKVNPNTTLQLTTASSTANQTLCINSNNLQTITYRTTNATDAKVTGLPAGLIWSYDNNQLIINGIPTQSGIFNYTVSTTGLCQTQQLSGTIIVSPNPIGFNDVINNLTCTNNSIQYNLQDNINNTANGGNSVPATFTWTVAPNNNVKGLNSGSGNNINATLINSSHTPQQVIYTVTPTSVTGGCPGKTFTVTINVPVCSSLSLTKTANVNLVSTAGDQIQYTITVKNTGTANHTSVQVTDPFLGGVLRGPAYGDNGNGILEANESWVYTGTYRVTQKDIDENGKPNARSGKIINKASLTTGEMSTPLTAIATVDIVTNGSIVLLKTGVISSDFSTIVYTFKITNNGRVKLYNLNLMDTKIGGQLNLGTTEIAAGASITVTATYKVSDEEKRDGRVVNTATIKGYTPSGDPVSDISGTQANNDEPTVHIIEDAPQAIDDKAEVQINQTVVINIAGNDIASLNGLNKASIESTQPSNGKVEVHMDGTVTYTPNKGYSGQDEFTYYIYDSKAGGAKISNRATVTITVIPIGLFIPNTITPNGDGKNDTFKIIGRESFDGIELLVFNRWGNEVYKNNNYLDEWDGSGLTEGTYYYVITLKKAGSKVNKNGWILIKR
ncbi:gliding motility-associated C-terminal domain-containing protein [Pedobacter sp. WC2423]|uniref:T9SS type B sorting domain-containing protein n=1 Tax=Pedobacter sp. WC2423 TaxID=3234142 RepID=UPI0034678792